jgi:hypothetical protein
VTRLNFSSSDLLFSFLTLIIRANNRCICENYSKIAWPSTTIWRITHYYVYV